MASQSRNRHATAQIVDIDAELAYWKTRLNEDTFQVVGATVSDLEKCLKIGYDAYLLHHRDPLDMLLPALKARYEHSLPSAQRLDWARGQSIIKETWQRMRAA